MLALYLKIEIELIMSNSELMSNLVNFKKDNKLITFCVGVKLQ